jgi:hypothetical protein
MTDPCSSSSGSNTAITAMERRGRARSATGLAYAVMGVESDRDPHSLSDRVQFQTLGGQRGR